MRETRTSGSEGGEPGDRHSPTPIRKPDSYFQGGPKHLRIVQDEPGSSADLTAAGAD